jgi:peptide/nickel transport system permease protein
MFNYILNRFLQAIPVLVVVGLISFAMFAFIGDPVQFMLGPESTEQERLELVARMGLDNPFYIQFLNYFWRMLHGEFGISYRVGIPVSELIWRHFPASFELVLVSMTLSVLLGLGLGIYTALRPKSPVAGGVMVASLIGVSLPTFVVGIFLILTFSVTLGWLPSFGRGDAVNLGFWETGLLTKRGWAAIILPSVTIALFQTTLIMRLVRGEMLTTMQSEFIKFARARGIRNRSIHFRHAFRNTLIPVVTIVGLQFGSVLSFAMVTETVFQWPGMGQLLVQSIRFVDIPVMSAYLMMIGIVFVVTNLVVDLLYFLIDPRLRKQMQSNG